MDYEENRSKKLDQKPTKVSGFQRTVSMPLAFETILTKFR